MIIYLITNKLNGKQYVGQTIHTLQERWANHCSSNSGCVALKGAIKKYGKDAFDLKEIDSANSQSELDEKERFWIERLNTLAPNGYNLKTGGEHPHLSEESIEKIRTANTGKVHGEETRKLISKRMKEQWAAGIRQGHPASEKVRENLRQLNFGKPSWNKGLPKELQPQYGKPKSKEQREKISKALSKPIYCVELNKVFDSAQQASKELGVAFPNISHCLHGRRQKAGGYHWRWADAS